MNKLVPIALLATLATFAVAPAAVYASESAAVSEAAAPVAVEAGKMIYGPNGQRIAAAYRVTKEGNVQAILNGKLVSIPAATLSEVDGKITTSLTRSQVARAR